VVIISHGLGGSRDGLAYLGEALAASGFLVVHPQHPGTDISVWRGMADPALAMSAAVLDVRRALDRLRDVDFVLDCLANPPNRQLAGRADLSRMAIAGHSFGAWTVTHMLGERLPGGSLLEGMLGFPLPDRRLLAGVALSPVPPLGIDPAVAYTRITAPILHITGTNDRGFIEAATPEDRTVPFHRIPAPGVLAVLAGAGHASFAGEPNIGGHFNDPTFHARASSLATLFLRATLLRDDAARALLLRRGQLAPADRLEVRGELA
jgi:dienelactone hydrolase